MKDSLSLPLWVAVPVAASAGIVLDAAFPDRGWWPLAFVGIALNLAVLIGRRLGADKKHPVPFGEYVPDRVFWRPFAPDLIDLVQRDYTPGTTDPIFDVGGVLVGINICFDVVDDRVLRASVLQGATVIFSSSNNADFGRSDQSAQQLAIARIRAMELGRSVVNVSTVGLTAAIGPDGEILQQLPWFTAASLVQDVSLINTVTPAALFGGQIEFGLSGLAVALLAGSSIYPAPRRRKFDSVITV